MARHVTQRWSDQHPVFARFLAALAALAGAAVAGVLSGGLVLLSSPPPEPEYITVAPPPPPVDPVLMLNTEHCEKGADTMVEVGDAVSTAGSVLGDEVASELDRAESRMARRVDVPSQRLTETFGELEIVLRDLRRAIEADDGVDAALDDTLDLISTLDGQCQDVLASDGGS